MGVVGAAAAWLTIGVQLGFVAGALGSSLLNLADLVRRDLLMAGAAALAAAANPVPLADPGVAGALAPRFDDRAALAGVYPPGMKLVATWCRRGRGFGSG